MEGSTLFFQFIIVVIFHRTVLDMDVVICFQYQTLSDPRTCYSLMNCDLWHHYLLFMNHVKFYFAALLLLLAT